MKTFSLDLCVSSLAMRLVAIGFVRDSKPSEPHIFQHRHNLFELQFVLDGSCSTRIGSLLYTQKQGEAYLVSPGVYHSQKSSTSPFEKMCIIFEVPAPPTSSSQSAKDVYFALSTAKYYSYSSADMEYALSSLKNAVLKYDKKTCETDEIRILTELLILKLIQSLSGVDSSELRRSPQEVERAYIIDEFFNMNFHRNDGDTLLAHTLGVCVRQLNRILKTLYGHNFREKLKEIRLEVSLDLLAGDNSIAEISEITGYSCPANFSTFIKNATGKTPSALRRMLKSD